MQWRKLNKNGLKHIFIDFHIAHLNLVADTTINIYYYNVMDYVPHRSHAVVMQYGSAPLLRQRGLRTERIVVPYSKGVNHMADLANVATVVWNHNPC